MNVNVLTRPPRAAIFAATPTTRAVDNFIAALRSKIEPDPAHPQFIETVRGTGYRLAGT